MLASSFYDILINIAVICKWKKKWLKGKEINDVWEGITVATCVEDQFFREKRSYFSYQYLRCQILKI